MVDTSDFPLFRKRQQPDHPLAPSPDSETYRKHAKRGMAIIFNHKNYSDKNVPERHGTDKDRDDLYAVLKDLNFDVNAYDDLAADEITDVLSRAKNIDHSEHDCLLVTVMSHGEYNLFYAKDKPYPTKALWESFFNVPSLAGKPKLFFIQACRGNNVDPGIMVSYDESDGKSKNKNLMYSIPITSDILVMYSTFEGFYSYRDPKNGTYFIQSLVHQLKNAEDRNILTLLTDVNRQVAVNYYDKEMCTIVSTLTRRFYIN